MAKPKLDLSGEGLKKLAINHCEKLVFGICGLMLLLLAYWGYSKPVFDDSKNNPNSLIAKADQSQTRIRSTTWDNPGNEELSFAKFRVADEEVPQKVEKLNLVEIDPSKYPAFAPGEISLSVKPKRTKPEILAASEVTAQFEYQLIALNPGVGGGSTRINEAMYAPEPKKAPRKAKKKKKKAKRPSRGGFGSGSGGSGMMEGGGNPGDSGSSPGSSGSGPPSSGGGGMAGGAGAGNKINKPDGPVHEVPDVMMAELEGVRLNGMIPVGTDNGQPLYPSVMRRQVVSVTAIVPFKKQVEAYEKALKGTRKYDPEKDIPQYIGLAISRRINGGEWKDITDEIEAFSKRAQSVTYPYLVEGDQYDPFLNAQVPAFLLQDFDSFVIHPKSSLRDFLEVEDEAPTKSKSEKKSSSGSFEDFNAAGEEKSEDEEAEADATDLYLTSDNAADTKQVRFFDLLANNAIKPGDKLEYRVNVILSNPNLPLSFLTGKEKTTPTTGSSGAMQGEDRSAGLMGAGGGAAPGSGAGGSAPPGSGGMSGGMSGYGGMSGGGRTISMSAELELEMLGNASITDADLDGAIRPDILKFKDQDPPEMTDKGLAKKYGLISPDSTVSNEVQFVIPGEKFVGGPAAPLSLRNADNVDFYDAEPIAEMIFLKNDNSLQLPVPGKTKVYAGSPVVFEAMAEVFNPLDWSIRWIGPPAVDKDGEVDPAKRGDYKFRSKAIVLDVQPSVELENISELKQEFLTPAEVLVFDGVGFTLRNELDDKKAYRHATFADEEEEEASDDIGGFGDRGGLQGSGGSSPGQFPGFGM